MAYKNHICGRIVRNDAIAIPCDLISVNSDDAYDVRELKIQRFVVLEGQWFSIGKNYSTPSSKKLEDAIYFFHAREDLEIGCFGGFAWFFLDKVLQVKSSDIVNGKKSKRR